MNTSLMHKHTFPNVSKWIIAFQKWKYPKPMCVKGFSEVKPKLIMDYVHNLNIL